jgi:hypothetical protein
MDESSERMRILEMIESGQVTAEEGLRLLAALQEPAEPEAGAIETAGLPPESPVSAPSETALGITSIPSPASPSSSEASSAQETPPGTSQASAEPVRPEVLPDTTPEDFDRWRRYWMIPLWIGVGITVLGGMLMYWALQSARVGFWLFCATIPFVIGVLVMVIGAQSRTAHWLHLRVQQPPGEHPQRIAISFPIPIGLASWFFRTFRRRIPGMDAVPENIDEILNAMRDSTSPENPIYIRVDDDEDGDKVEIFIG